MLVQITTATIETTTNDCKHPSNRDIIRNFKIWVQILYLSFSPMGANPKVQNDFPQKIWVQHRLAKKTVIVIAPNSPSLFITLKSNPMHIAGFVS